MPPPRTPFRFNSFISTFLPPTKERKDLKSFTATPSFRLAATFEGNMQEEEEEGNRRETGKREKGKKEEHGIKKNKDEKINNREHEEIDEEDDEEDEEEEGNRRTEKEVNVDGLERRCLLGYGSLNKLLDSEYDIKMLEVAEEQSDCVIEDNPKEAINRGEEIAKHDTEGYQIRITDEFKIVKTENESLIHQKNTGGTGTSIKEEEENMIELNKLVDNVEEERKKENNEEEKEEDDKNTRDLWGEEEDEDIRFRYQEQYKKCKY